MKPHKSHLLGEVITKDRWGLWENCLGKGKRIRFSYSGVTYEYAHDVLYELAKRKRPDLFQTRSWVEYRCFHDPKVAQTNRGKNGFVKDFLDQHIVGT